MRFPNGEVWKVSQQPTEAHEQAGEGELVSRVVYEGPWLSEDERLRNRENLLDEIYNPALQLKKPDQEARDLSTFSAEDWHWAAVVLGIILAAGIYVTYWG